MTALALKAPSAPAIQLRPYQERAIGAIGEALTVVSAAHSSCSQPEAARRCLRPPRR